jgi:aminocarboxymuconate-semialdehyde decarboxylase
MSWSARIAVPIVEPGVADILRSGPQIQLASDPDLAKVPRQSKTRRMEYRMTTPVIDVHAHLVPSELVKILRREGIRYGVEMSGPEDAPKIQLTGGKLKPFPKSLMQLEERIATLDRQGIDMQVVASWIDLCGYTMPLDLAVAFSELQNEHLAAAVAAHPHRLAGAANVPLQDTRAAIAMLERAVRDQGFRAVQLSTYRGPGRFLDDTDLDPFWQAAQELNVFILLHPYDEQPTQGLNEYFLHNCIGYPLQTSLAVIRMIFAGVLARFPDLKINLPHSGGFLPYQIDRFRHAADHRPEPRAKGFTGDVLDTFRKFHFDTVAFNPRPLRYLADVVGAERLVLGSDYPFEMSDPDPVTTAKAALPAHMHDAVLGGTVQKIMGLSPTRGANGRPLTPLARAV